MCKTNEHSQKHFFHVEGCLRDTNVVGEEVLFHLVTLVMTCIIRASWSDFQQAAAQMTMADDRNVIGEKTFKAAYHWTQVNGERQDDSMPLFSNGSPMDPKSIAELKKEPFPIQVAHA